MYIDTQSNIALGATTVATFASGSCAITSSDAVLQTNSAYTFTLQATNPIPLGGYLTMVVPSAVGVPGALTISCDFGCTSTIAPALVSGTWELRGLFVTAYTTAGSTIIFTITGFTNPASITPALFTMTSRDTSSGDYAIDTISTLSITATQGIITISVIKPTDSYKIYDIPTSYTITLTIQHAVATNY